MEELQEALRQAQEETNATRQKLRNAVKKGKAIDEERQGLVAKVQELEQERGNQKGDERGAVEVEALQAHVAEYKEKLKNAIKKGKGIDAERLQLKEEVELLRQRLETKEICTPAEVETLQTHVAEYKEKLRNAVKKGKAIEAERQRLQEQVAALQGQQAQPQAGPAVEELVKSLDEHKHKLQTAVERGQSFETDLAVKVLEDSYSSGQERAAVQQEALEAAVAKVAKAQATSDKAAKLLKEAFLERDGALATAEDLGAELEQRQKETAEAQSNFQLAQAKVKQVEEALHARESQLAVTQEELSALQASSAAAADSESAVAGALEEAKKTSRDLVLARQEIGHLQERLRDHEEVEAALHARESKLAATQEELAALQASSAAAAESQSAAADALEEAKQASRDLELARQEIGHLQERLREHEEVEEDLHARESQLAATQEELAVLQASSAAAADSERAAAGALEEAKQASRDLELARQEIGHLQERLREHEEAEEALFTRESQLHATQEELAALRAGLATAADSERAAAGALEEAKQASRDLELARQEIGHLQERLRDHEEAARTAAELHLSSTEEKTRLEEEAKRAHEHATQLSAELEETRAKLQAPDQAQGQPDSEEVNAMLKEQAAEVEAQLRTSTAALEAEVSSLQERLGKAQADLAALGQERDGLREKLASAELSADKLPAEDGPNMLESRLESANEEISMLKSAMAAAAVRIQESSNARQEAESQLEQRADEAAALRRKLAEVEGKLEVLDHLEEQAAKLHGELEAARRATEAADQTTEAVKEAKSLAEAQVARLEEQLAQAEASAGSRVVLSKERAAELEAKAAQIEEMEALVAEKEKKAEETMRRAKASEEKAAIREAAAEQRVAAAQAEARRVTSEAEERSRRFAHVQSIFAKKEAAFDDRQAAARAEADSARSEAAEASAAAATARLEEEMASARAQELEAAVESLERDKAKLLAQVAEADERLMCLELEASKVEVVQVQASEAERRADSLAAEAKRLESERIEMALRAEAAEALAKETERQNAKLHKEFDRKVKETESLRASREQAIRGLLERGDGPTDAPKALHAAAAGGSGEEGTLESELEHLREENLSLKSQVSNVERRIASEKAGQAARINALEKTNQQLTWQIAMTANSGAMEEGRGAAPGMSKPSGALSPRDDASKGAKAAPQGITFASVIGWVLAHRKLLIAAYLTILHLMVYFALTHGAFSFSSYAKLQCDAPTQSELALTGPAKLQAAPPPFLLPSPSQPEADQAQAMGHAVGGGADHRHLGDLPVSMQHPAEETEEQVLHQTIGQRFHRDAVDGGQQAQAAAVEPLPDEAQRQQPAG